MAKITLRSAVDVEVDTDTFTFEQWKKFIKQNLSPQEIERTIKNDLFPLERLKERAIIAYQLVKELGLE